MIQTGKSKKEHLPQAEFIGSFGGLTDMPSEAKEVCFLGRSNAGKSSLIASLMQNSSLVKISKKPGSTRTLNLFKWGDIQLADLPGYGYAKASNMERKKLSGMISLYLEERENLKYGFLLIDCFREVSSSEKYIIDLFKFRKIPLAIVLTKSDRLNQKERSALEKKWNDGLGFGVQEIILASARTGFNLDYLINFLKSF